MRCRSDSVLSVVSDAGLLLGSTCGRKHQLVGAPRQTLTDITKLINEVKILEPLTSRPCFHLHYQKWCHSLSHCLMAWVGKKRKRMWCMSSWRSKSSFGGKIKNVQKRGTKDIFFIIVVIILIITGLASAAPCAGGPLNGGGPLDWAGQGGRRSDVLHVVRQAELVEALRCIFALWRLVGWAQRLGAVGVAQHTCGRQFVPLDPRVVITDDILVVQPRQQRHLAFDPSELLTGWVHLDAFHRVVTTV